MKFRIVYREEDDSIFPWPSRYRGVVLYPYIIMRPRIFLTKTLGADLMNNKLELETLFRHELEHCYQIQRYGVLRFYLKYVWIFLLKGYRNHSLELEATEVQRVKLTPIERRWLEQGLVDLSDLDT